LSPFRILSAESRNVCGRFLGSIETNPRIQTATRPAADRNCNPARGALHDVPRLRNRWRYVARCTAIAKPVAVCCTMYRDCETGGGMLHDVPRLRNRGRYVARCTGPQRIAIATRLGVRGWCVFGSCNLAPWITTANRPASDPSSGLHRVPARSGSQRQPGPVRVARCTAIAKPVAVCCTMYRPAADRKCNPARGAWLVRATWPHGSQLQTGPVRVARCTAIAKPVAVCCTMYRNCETGGGMLHDVPRLQNRWRYVARCTGPQRIAIATRLGVRVWCVQPGPMDHNFKPARCALHDVPRLRNRWQCVQSLTRSGTDRLISMVSKSKHGPQRIATATRLGVRGCLCSAFCPQNLGTFAGGWLFRLL
jgi:ribosomal protein S30